jgi:hypothetical protein
MKHLKTLALVTILASTFAATVALAGPIHTRQGVQRSRIKQGVQNGSLTAKERKVLNAEQRVIKKARRRALSDGVMTGKEAKGLTHMQNKASKDIYRLKHNKREQPQ